MKKKRILELTAEDKKFIEIAAKEAVKMWIEDEKKKKDKKHESPRDGLFT